MAMMCKDKVWPGWMICWVILAILAVFYFAMYLGSFLAVLEMIINCNFKVSTPNPSTPQLYPWRGELFDLLTGNRRD